MYRVRALGSSFRTTLQQACKRFVALYTHGKSLISKVESAHARIVVPDREVVTVVRVRFDFSGKNAGRAASLQIGKWTRL